MAALLDGRVGLTIHAGITRHCYSKNKYEAKTLSENELALFTSHSHICHLALTTASGRPAKLASVPVIIEALNLTMPTGNSQATIDFYRCDPRRESWT